MTAFRTDNECAVLVATHVDMHGPVFLTLCKIDCEVVVEAHGFVVYLIPDFRADILFYDNH